MEHFYNVTQADRDEVIDKCLNKVTLMKTFTELGSRPDLFEVAIKSLDSNVTTITQYRVFKKDLEWTKNVGKYKETEFLCEKGLGREAFIKRLTDLEFEIARLKPVRIFCGPLASSVIRIMTNFKAENVHMAGIYRFGTLSNVPVFKAPADVIPNDSIIVENSEEIKLIKLLDVE